MSEMQEFSLWLLDSLSAFFASGPMFYLFGLILFLFIIKVFLLIIKPR